MTKCLYSKTSKEQSKTLGVLQKSIQYFEVNSIGISGKKIDLIDTIIREFPHLTINGSHYDLYFSDISEYKELPSHFHNDSILVIDSIYKKKAFKKYWELLKNKMEVTVTLDLFCCGVVFFRKGQAREHFKIRI